MSINDRLKAAQKNGRAEKLLELAGEWSLSDGELGDGEGGWERKVEELAVLVTLMACATGRQGHPPKVDFFLVRIRSIASSVQIKDADCARCITLPLLSFYPHICRIYRHLTDDSFFTPIWSSS